MDCKDLIKYKMNDRKYKEDYICKFILNVMIVILFIIICMVFFLRIVIKADFLISIEIVLLKGSLITLFFYKLLYIDLPLKNSKTDDYKLVWYFGVKPSVICKMYSKIYMHFFVFENLLFICCFMCIYLVNLWDNLYILLMYIIIVYIFIIPSYVSSCKKVLLNLRGSIKSLKNKTYNKSWLNLFKTNKIYYVSKTRILLSQLSKFTVLLMMICIYLLFAYKLMIILGLLLFLLVINTMYNLFALKYIVKNDCINIDVYL